MHKTITLLTTSGEKPFPMLANAATPVIFRRVFHQDLLIEYDRYVLAYLQLQADPDTLVKGGIEVDFGLPGKLAYIMSAAAEKAAGDTAALSALSPDGYMEWLEGFEAAAFTLAGADIFGLYGANQQTSSTGKK